MSVSTAGDLPEEFRLTLPEQTVDEPVYIEPLLLTDRSTRPEEPEGTAWLLAGLLLLIAAAVLLLLIFASGGNADESMML